MLTFLLWYLLISHILSAVIRLLQVTFDNDYPRKPALVERWEDMLSFIISCGFIYMIWNVMP